MLGASRREGGQPIVANYRHIGPVDGLDAASIALAERLGAALITCDAGLATANGPTCAFDLIT